MLKRFLLACALVAAPLPAQTAPPSPNLAGIAHVALRVKDLDASVAFYQKLGFVKAFELSKDGKVYEAFIKINDHQFIELYPVDAKNTQVGFLHVCFEGNDLQSVHDYYVSKGLTPNAVRTAGAGNLLFTMPGPMTPQGPQNMEYTQYMPGSLHSKDFGQHLGKDRISTEMTRVSVKVDDLQAAQEFYTSKAGFPSIAQDRSVAVLQLPPASPAAEQIELLGEGKDHAFIARIYLRGDVKKAKKRFESEHILGGMVFGRLLTTDPDENQILIEPASR